MNLIVLFQLFLAHILADFVFQTKVMADAKRIHSINTKYYWIHILSVGVLSYLFLMQWLNWSTPLLIMLSHGVIDYIKAELERRRKCRSKTLFFVDQIIHLVALLIVWIWLEEGWSEIMPFVESGFDNIESISIITAVILLTTPIGMLIGRITEPFKKELPDDRESLKKAGVYIGVFERLLVFIFILMGQYGAIGFLIAAKSILRVTTDNERGNRKKTEYVLIGTLISFTIAIVVSLTVVQLIK
jgi:hypothetical protein